MTLKIVVAGASGYIGRAIIPQLLERFPDSEIIALSRTEQKSEDARVVWKVCDLFSLDSLERAAGQRADLALYLVHSMGPSATLDQGSFADYDLLLADNFARVAQKMQIRHLIYLGGLIPDAHPLSLHLQSRLEIEQTFVQYALPMTVFRAAIILGEAGSSFQILLKLVKRLPIMLCPAWTRTITTPVDLPTVLRAIILSALDQRHIGQVYDLAGCKPLTYLEMMKQTAQQLGKKRYFLTVPFFTPTLSRLWVRLITNSPKDLVYPLLASLEHAMLARESHLFFKDASQVSYSDLLETTPMTTRPGRSIFQFKPRRKTIRSVQRLRLPAGRDAEWVKHLYLSWLPHFLKPFIKVSLFKSCSVLSLLRRSLVLLQLTVDPERSDGDRQVLQISGGLLVAKENRGQFEFRVVLNRQYVIAAIHDYRPSLPRLIYRNTQAKIHLYVMTAFARELYGHGRTRHRDIAAQ